MKCIESINNPKKIVLLCLHAIGDTIMFLPTIRAVSEYYSESKVIVFVRSYLTQCILETARLKSNVSIMNFAEVDLWRYKRTCVGLPSNLLRFNPVNFSVLMKLRSLKPDVTIAMSRMHPRLTPLMLKFSRSLITIGESYGWGRTMLTHPVETRQKSHRIYRNLSLLKALNMPIPEKADIRIFPADRDIQEMQMLMCSKTKVNKRSFFAVAPCVTPGQIWRLWPCHFWGDLISQLAEYYDATAFILGGSSDEDHRICNEIKTYIKPGLRVYNLGGKLSIKHTIALIALMDFICGVDCGLLHTAASVGTFINAIWSATPIEHYPFTEKKKIIHLPCQCAGNYPSSLKRSCMSRPECMEKFTPQMAYNAITSE